MSGFLTISHNLLSTMQHRLLQITRLAHLLSSRQLRVKGKHCLLRCCCSVAVELTQGYKCLQLLLLFQNDHRCKNTHTPKQNVVDVDEKNYCHLRAKLPSALLVWQSAKQLCKRQGIAYLCSLKKKIRICWGN